MTEAEIYAGLTEIFHELFDDAVVLRADTTAADVPGWDSFTHLNLIVAAELRFGVKFQTGEIERMNNVGDLVALILGKTT